MSRFLLHFVFRFYSGVNLVLVDSRSMKASCSVVLSVDSFEPDMYNPEAPSLNSRPVYRPRVNVQRSNLIGLTMGEVDLPPRGNILYMACNSALHTLQYSYHEWE